jgi:hypothetical protein
MQGFGPSTYGDGFADVYDHWYGNISDAEATAAFVSARCGSGPLLELGVGSGRLVPALQNAGCEVIGLDASQAMLERCPAELVTVQADLAALPLRSDRTIGGALCAFNTLFNLPSADAQRSLMEQLATVVSSDGTIVIEATTGIGLADSPPQSVGVSRMTAAELVLSATLVDRDAQTIQGQHVEITEAGISMRPWLLRWTTPPQLDELATAAGLVLVERWSDWDESPFTEDSEQHITVYRPS